MAFAAHVLHAAVSMQVLDGCPWVLPRPVFLLTSQQWGWQAADGIQSTYTLRIKMVKEGAADAIAQVSCRAPEAATYTATTIVTGYLHWLHSCTTPM